METDSINSLISIFGALLAVASLILSIFTLWVDKPNILFTVQLGYSLIDELTGKQYFMGLEMAIENKNHIKLPNKIPKIMCFITNNGKRPLFIKEVIIKKSTQNWVSIHPFIEPKKLDSYELMPYLSTHTIEELEYEFGNILTIAVTDTTGKKWKVEPKSFKIFENDFKKKRYSSLIDN